MDVFRKEVVNSRNTSVYGVVTLNQSLSTNAIICFLVGLTVSILLLFYLIEYSKKIHVTGFIQPQLGEIKVSSVKPGVIKEILVNEGDIVTAGQTVFKVHGNNLASNGTFLHQKVIEDIKSKLNVQKSLLSLLNENKTNDLVQIETKEALYRQLLENLNSQLKLVEKKKEISSAQMSNITGMLKKGYISKLEYYLQEEKAVNLTQEYQSLSNSVIKQKSALSLLGSEKEKVMIEYSIKKKSVLSNLLSLESELHRKEGEAIFDITANVTGVVTGIRISRGELFKANQYLLTILPEHSEMQAVLLIPTHSIQDIKEGMSLVVTPLSNKNNQNRFKGLVRQVDRTVLLSNEVTNFPLDNNVPMYRAIGKLDTDNLGNLKSGMKINAQIILSQQTIIEWLFSSLKWKAM